MRHLETLAIHAGREGLRELGVHALPIDLSTTIPLPDLQVTAITFSVSRERRATIEDELIAKALEAFKQRADLVRRQLAGKDYRIMDVSINPDGIAPAPRPMMRNTASMETASAAAPAVQAGTSTISVSVSGTIELQ